LLFYYRISAKPIAIRYPAGRRKWWVDIQIKAPLGIYKFLINVNIQDHMTF
jgi:hypothetical protein